MGARRRVGLRGGRAPGGALRFVAEAGGRDPEGEFPRFDGGQETDLAAPAPLGLADAEYLVAGDGPRGVQVAEQVAGHRRVEGRDGLAERGEGFAAFGVFALAAQVVAFGGWLAAPAAPRGPRLRAPLFRVLRRGARRGGACGGAGVGGPFPP